MKIFCAILFTCFVSLSASSQSKKFRDIIGYWKIAGEKNASLQVIDSTTIILNYMGETKTLVDCKMDFSKSPAWFDFQTKDSSSTLVVKSLLQVIGDDMIKWQLFIDEDRPNYFSSTKGELFYLKKSGNSTGTAVATN